MRMEIIIDLALLLLGLVLLVQSAKVFVDASVNIARRLQIPSMVIGLTVVAMGTSAPEAVISVSAALGGSGDLAVANIVGSNIFNLLFIVGFCALLYPITVQLKAISRDYWVSAGATVFLFLLVLIFGYELPRWGSLVLLLAFMTYMVVVVRHALKNKVEEARRDAASPKPVWRSIVFTILGAALIVLGGHLTVTSAVNLALDIGVTERVVGLTIVAMGTSLPELVTTLIACRKGEGAFALGFIIGSSIFNIMFVLGIAGLITPLAIGSSVILDMAVLTAGTLAFFLFARSSRKLVRLEGLAMVLMYAAYMGAVIWLA
ncbi:MAG: calcium/sodium antiporter [Oscillospiraceae bacterium]|nr:calcium/sodium antiporter [Oscillospiraceae bacterium]